VFYAVNYVHKHITDGSMCCLITCTVFWKFKVDNTTTMIPCCFIYHEYYTFLMQAFVREISMGTFHGNKTNANYTRSFTIVKE